MFAKKFRPIFHAIDFSAKNSIASIFGFEKKVYKREEVVHIPNENDFEYLDSLFKLTMVSEKIINIMPINKIHLNCDCILGSLKNGISHSLYFCL